MRLPAELQPEACVKLMLDAPGGRLPATIAISNECDHDVAVLTTPLEVRVRVTGKEALINERMASWAAYAILYVARAELRGEAFRGDGIIRDGGGRVQRPPGYTTVSARSIVKVPFRCKIDVPSGRYFLPITTFEAPQGTAPARNDPFDCAESLEHYNSGAEREITVYLGSDVRQVSSESIAVDLGME